MSIPVIKIAVGGNGGVGKTTFINRYIENVFVPETKMTVGVQFHMKRTTVSGMDVNLVIWDLAGQERFKFVLPSYITGSKAGIVMFDMSRVETLLESDSWFNIITDNGYPGMPIMLVGAKQDTIVEDEEMENMVKEAIKHATMKGYDAYTFTSSKSGTGVTESIDFLVDLLLKKFNGTIPD